MDPHGELQALVERLAQVAHPDAPEPARQVLAARDLRDILEEVYLDAGAAAHDAGMSWAAIAAALGLSGAGSAHFLFGDGRQERLDKLRQRTARAKVDPPPHVPGISVDEAAARLGVSPATLRRRIASGHIKATLVESPGGRTRWVVDEADLARTEA